MFCGNIITSEEYDASGCCSNCKTSDCFQETSGPVQIDVIPNVFEIYCPLYYRNKVKDVLIQYKFQGENWLATPLAILLHNYLLEHGGYQYCDYITSVPISSKRFAIRGYNQAELIARKLSELSGIPYQDFLLRNNSKGDIQTGKMNRIQRFDVQRFEAQKTCAITENTGVLLVDDILTTGSTLKACAEILLNMGVSFVKAAVLASGRRDLGGISA